MFVGLSTSTYSGIPLATIDSVSGMRLRVGFRVGVRVSDYEYLFRFNVRDRVRNRFRAGRQINIQCSIFKGKTDLLSVI